jgi:hypothetical protein
MSPSIQVLGSQSHEEVKILRDMSLRPVLELTIHLVDERDLKAQSGPVM